MAASELIPITIDPQGAEPDRRRWFGLDDIALQAELMEVRD
jgi:hypothetical protein